MTKRIDETEIHEQHYEEIRSFLEQEPYAQYLGMKLVDLGLGTATAELVPTKDMVNAHNTVHGAVLFSLADYVFAVASNSYGKTAVGVTTTMNFMSAAFAGEKSPQLPAKTNATIASPGTQLKSTMEKN